MLILTRKPGESINIGDDVSVVVLSNRGNQVRIGINAPKEVTILREEVAEQNRRDAQKQVADESAA